MSSTTTILLAVLGILADTLPPNAAGVVWTPSVISTLDYEAAPTFSPDGRELYFMVGNPSFTHFSLRVSTCSPEGWTVPVRPSFARPLPVQDADPHVTSDGKLLYFISTRQNIEHGDDDFDIWVTQRQEDGSWAEPNRLPEPVNSNGSELLPRTTRDGRLYFGSDRAGGFGAMDIYEAYVNSHGEWIVKNVGAPINTEHAEYEAEISEDGNTLVLVADRGDRSHLYLFERETSNWVEQYRVPARSDVFQVGPLLSPRKDRLLFAQAEPRRSGEILLIDLNGSPDKSWPPNCRSNAQIVMP